MLYALLINIGWILAILLFVVFGYTAGSEIWRLFKLPDHQKIDKLIINTVLGWGVVGYLIWLIGLTKLNLSYSIYFVTFFILILLIIKLNNIKFSKLFKFEKLSIIQKFLLFLCGIFLVVSLIGALSPEREFDATWYHLPEAKWFLQNSSTRLIYPSMLGTSSLAPKLPEILFVWLLAFGKNEILPHLLQWISAFGMGLASYSIARRFTGKANALLASLILLSSREILWLSSNAYIDNIYGIFGIAVCLAILVFSEKNNSKNIFSFVTVIGILAGLMFSTKMQALVFIAAIAFAVFSIRKNIKDVYLSIIISLIVVFPWYLEIWISTGHPFTGVIAAAPGDERYGGGKSFTDWVINVYPRAGYQDMTKSIKGSFQTAILALIPFVYWKKIKENKIKILLTATLLGWLGWTLIPVHLVRYMAPIFPLVSVMVAISFDYIKKWLKPILILTILFILVFDFATIFNYNHRVINYVIGRESRNEILTSLYKNNIFTLFDYEGVIKNKVQSEKVLGMIHNSYFAPVKYYDAIAFAGKNRDINSTSDAFERINKENIKFILVYHPYSIDTIISELNIKEDSEKEIFKSKINLVYSNESGANLYEIK